MWDTGWLLLHLQTGGLKIVVDLVTSDVMFAMLTIIAAIVSIVFDV